MADDDVVRGGAVPGVDECRRRGRARGDVCRCGRRRQRVPSDVCSGRPLMRPDGTAATCRRMSGRVAAVAATRPTGRTLTERRSTDALPSDRTLVSSVGPRCATSRPLLNVRLTDAIWRPGAVGNSILRRSVSVVLRCRRHQYARSRRRRPSGFGGGGATPSGLAASVAASLLAAALLVGSVAADHRRFHRESSHAAAAASRQLAPRPESSDGRGAARRSQSDDIGAGIPCIYEGHIKTDR